MDLNYRKKLIVRPESKVRLADFDPAFTGKHEVAGNGAAGDRAVQAALWEYPFG